MRTLWIDPVGGLAGDMLVAALLDAGADEAALFVALSALEVPGWSATTERVWRGPFSALRFVVALDAVAAAHHDHSHGHGHDHDHTHPVEAAHGSAWRARSRRWSDIRAWLEAAPLAPRVRERALAAFARLAIAEGRVHGIPAESVTFHEVGAVDSIVDVVAVCLLLEAHGVDRLVVGPLPLGQGHTLGEHGWIPLPAPATVACLEGLVVEGIVERGETVTPTGAALVGALATSGPMPAMRILASGVGAGTRDPASRPNVVRVVLGEGDPGALTRIVELTAEVDSLHPEAIPTLLSALLDAGAVDASCTPILMKKGRPGYRLTVLSPPTLRAPIGDVLLRHGRTLGYRFTEVQREVLARTVEAVETSFGQVRVKLGERAGEVWHAAPEYEDVAAAALAHGVPTAEVYASALASWSRRAR